MANYQNVIISLELNHEADRKIVQQAKLVSAQSANFYLVHAVEHLSNYGAAYGVTAGVDLEEVLMKEAARAMEQAGAEFNIPEQNRIVKVGPAKFVILEEATNLKADLIVCGSHGHHGLRILLGSTANAILHNAKCDVLAVRVCE